MPFFSPCGKTNRGFWHPEPGPGKPSLVTVEFLSSVHGGFCRVDGWQISSLNSDPSHFGGVRKCPSKIGGGCFGIGERNFTLKMCWKEIRFWNFIRTICPEWVHGRFLLAWFSVVQRNRFLLINIEPDRKFSLDLRCVCERRFLNERLGLWIYTPENKCSPWILMVGRLRSFQERLAVSFREGTYPVLSLTLAFRMSCLEVSDPVDGRNPAPVDSLSQYLHGFYTSQVVQDFFHQQYLYICSMYAICPCCTFGHFNWLLSFLAKDGRSINPHIWGSFGICFS